MTNRIKVVYLGMDVLLGCLELLVQTGYEVVHVGTMPDDAYDRTCRIQDYAEQHQIPCSTKRLTREQLEQFEEMGAGLMIVAGYVWKIPLSRIIRQVNIHPAYLPVGRGSWPMPAAILRGEDSGVTLHRLSEGFDEGDILLQERIAVGAEETLETLTCRIQELAACLLGRFLEQPDWFWQHAVSQGAGEYWDEPRDEERTFALSDAPEKISRIVRAFYGYGSLCRLRGLTIEVIRGRVVEQAKYVEDTKDGELSLRLSDAVLCCEEWQIVFREIRLEDREKVERIRERYQPQLSDYTFALLYCWQETLGFSMYLEDDFFVIRGDGYFLFPVGSKQRVRDFLDGLLELGMKPKFRFCDERMLAFVRETYPGRFRYEDAPDDSDYVLSNQIIRELPGKSFASRRKDFSHFKKLQPPPEILLVTEENAKYMQEISRRFGGPDRMPEQRAIDHFFELGMMGILVRQGTEYVGFSMCSRKDEQTMQGHFMKCTSLERGSKFYLMKSCLDRFSDQYAYTDIEDDMGDEGLRKYKSSFKPEKILSYTIVFS